MDNCANQLVLYGAREAVAALQAELAAAGAICLPLPFDRGYHTADFADVSAAFRDYYGRIKLRAPRVPLYSCASTRLFPGTAAAVRKLAAAQWSQPVRFRETIEQMVADGVDCFVEVGPSGNLTAFVNDIPAGRAQTAIASNLRRRDGVEQLLTVLAQLYASGRRVRLDSLFAGRRIARVDLDQSADSRPYGVLLDNTMPVLRYSQGERETLRTWAAAEADAAAVSARRQRSQAAVGGGRSSRCRHAAATCRRSKPLPRSRTSPNAIRAPMSWPSTSTSCAASSSSSGRSSSRGRAATAAGAAGAEAPPTCRS